MIKKQIATEQHLIGFFSRKTQSIKNDWSTPKIH